MNQKRFRRLYREEGLGGAQAWRPQAGVGHASADRASLAANERWSLDFVSDSFTDGRRFRILAVVDDFTRECLALVADTSLSGDRVARELDAVIARRRAKPRTCVSDNGTELTSMAILAGARPPASTGITSSPASRNRTRSSRVSTAGCATNSSTRRCSRRSARRELLAAWRDDYNQVRPHSALANRTPEEFHDHHLALAVTNDQVQKLNPGLTL